MDSTISSDIVRECSERQERSAEDTVVVEKDKRNNIEELCSKLLDTVVLQPSVCIIGAILHPWGRRNKSADHIMVCVFIIVVVHSSCFSSLRH